MSTGHIRRSVQVQDVRRHGWSVRVTVHVHAAGCGDGLRRVDGAKVIVRGVGGGVRFRAGGVAKLSRVRPRKVRIGQRKRKRGRGDAETG